MRLSLALVLLVASASATASPLDPPRRRFAVVVGANDGGTGRQLRHAVSDARGFAAVMESLGGIQVGDRVLLENPAPGSIEKELAAIGSRLAAAREAASAVELVFYYSGHSDEGGLLIQGQRLPYADLRRLLNAVPADFRVAILDSCASGSFTRAKGGAPASPFLLDRSSQVTGEAVLTSSTATEASQESDRLGASFFTHHLLSGLRGAADVSRDGKVTLNEVYQFAFNETLARTERTRAGAQHPSYDMAVAGTGDLVLTDLRSTQASLLLPERLVGHLFLRNALGVLVTELRKTEGTTTELGLEPGSYEVTLVQGSAVLGGTVAVPPGRTAVLELAALRQLPAEANPLRGEAMEASLGIRLWHTELNLTSGSDLSESPAASVADEELRPIQLGATYFIRPLRDDRVTPFGLMRFFQRPDELSVLVVGFSRGIAVPQVDLGITVYPWQFLGITGGVGLDRGGLGGTELGYRAHGMLTYFPRPDLRLSASYLVARYQSTTISDSEFGTLYGPPSASLSISNTDAASARVTWVSGYRWRVDGLYRISWDQWSSRGTNGSSTPYPLVPAHFAQVEGNWFPGRNFSVGLRADVRVIPIVSTEPDGRDRLSVDYVRFLVGPRFQWWITDSLALTGAFGLGNEWGTLGNYESYRFALLSGTLSFSARF